MADAAARAEAFAAEVESWVDTPFHWQQRTKGRGCDCKGLVAGAAGELGYPEADSVWALKGDYGKRRPVDSPLLIEGMTALFDRATGEPARGDLLLYALPNARGAPFHMAVALGEGRTAHAQMGLNSKVRIRHQAVIEQRFVLHSVWRWRGDQEAEG